MGILDDAIREHLDLKRRHGASEEELRQQEVEALGTPSVATPEDAEPAPEGALEHAPDVADGNGGAPVAEDELEPEGGDEPLEHEPEEAPAAPEPELEEPELEPEPELAPEPEPAPEPESEFDEPEAVLPADDDAPPSSGDTPARGFDAVEEPEDEDAPAEPDVLEDTPDFLQETPEHDRLWFEQKPPRDFDFD